MCSRAFMQHHSRRQRQSTATCEAITTHSTAFACFGVAMLQVTRTSVVALCCGARCVKCNIYWNVLHATNIWTHTRAINAFTICRCIHRCLVACIANTLLLLACYLSCMYKCGCLAIRNLCCATFSFYLAIYFDCDLVSGAVDNANVQLIIMTCCCEFNGQCLREIVL